MAEDPKNEPASGKIRNDIAEMKTDLAKIAKILNRVCTEIDDEWGEDCGRGTKIQGIEI